jgi:hypothetical protein
MLRRSGHEARYYRVNMRVHEKANLAFLSFSVVSCSSARHGYGFFLRILMPNWPSLTQSWPRSETS